MEHQNCQIIMMNVKNMDNQPKESNNRDITVFEIPTQVMIFSTPFIRPTHNSKRSHRICTNSLF